MGNDDKNIDDDRSKRKEDYEKDRRHKHDKDYYHRYDERSSSSKSQRLPVDSNSSSDSSNSGKGNLFFAKKKSFSKLFSFDRNCWLKDFILFYFLLLFFNLGSL